MRYRKLRIAWSVAWGLVCVLVIVLWVRSGWWVDSLTMPHSGNRFLILGTAPGTIGGSDYPASPPANNDWHFSSFPTDKWLKAVQENKLFSVSRVWGRFYFGDVGFSVPDWFALIVLTTLTSLPWLGYMPNRFSLRTLLIAMTLVAVVLGLIVWAGG